MRTFLIFMLCFVHAYLGPWAHGPHIVFDGGTESCADEFNSANKISGNPPEATLRLFLVSVPTPPWKRVCVGVGGRLGVSEVGRAHALACQSSNLSI